nr:ethylene-responsive transcription factor RAP2-6-like [Aegilops tauschii subsp. strangulata]
MPPRRQGGSGFRGVRVRPSGTYSASIRLGGGVHLGLRTFDTAQDGARAYDAAAWRFRRSRWDMNFTDVATLERMHQTLFFKQNKKLCKGIDGNEAVGDRGADERQHWPEAFSSEAGVEGDQWEFACKLLCK